MSQSLQPQPSMQSSMGAHKERTMQPEAIPTYRPLVTACAEHGISRSVAFELARIGKLETFTIGTRRYVYLDSLRTLPERLAAEAAKVA